MPGRAGFAWLLALGLAAMLVLMLVLVLAGEWLSRPAQRPQGPPPADLAARAVSLPVAAPAGPRPAAPVAGWYTPGQPGRGAVLLLHGVRGDRRQMLGRARFLARQGYATLMIDLPAHGESVGSRITFGAREAEGVRAAVGFLRRELPGQPLGIIGVSLGGAATVLAGPLGVDAVVLESVYGTFEEAVSNRLTMRLGPAGAWLVAPLLWPLPLRTGLQPEALRPLAHIGQIGAPVLVAAGALDRHTSWPETLRLHEAARPPKALWRVEGAAHVDLHAHAPAAYEATVGAFFAQHLGPHRP